MKLLREQRRIIEQQEKTIREQQQIIQAQTQEIAQLKETVQHLRNEIAILKGIKPKPKMEPSQLGKDKKKNTSGKRPGSEKRQKTAALKIHETKTVRPKNLPPDAQFKGYREFTIQDLLITAHNTLYRLERWESADGQPIEAQLPSHLNGHFGNALKSYILYQYHQCHVTQPLLF